MVCLIHREKSAFVALNWLRHGTLCAFSWDPFLLSDDNTEGFKSLPANIVLLFSFILFGVRKKKWKAQIVLKHNKRIKVDVLNYHHLIDITIF